MAQRTIVQVVQDIVRTCRGQVNYHRAYQGLQDALDKIDAFATWEFLIAHQLIHTVAPYDTGTVTATVGSTTVTGSGTTWDATWTYREIKFNDRDIPYKIASVTNATTLVLAQAFGGEDDITAGEYAIFQARYPLPSNCDPARDLVIKGPNNTGYSGNGDIKKFGRLKHEWTTDAIPRAHSVWYYTDDEYDDTLQRGTIRFEPYPRTADTYRITYYRKLTIPTTESESLILPQAFERLPILLASSEIMQDSGQQGWLQKREEANVLMQKMYKRHAASPAYDNDINPRDEDEFIEMFGADNKLYIGGGMP